jgi:hypothetical protein
MRRKANRTSRKTPIKVVLDIKPGPVSPAQRMAWKRLWDKLLSEVKGDESEGSGSQ